MIDNKDFSKLRRYFKNTRNQDEEESTHTLSNDEAGKYIAFVMCTYAMVCLLFIKIKTQLQMSRKMDQVVQLMEESLSDAAYFLIYYAFILILFAVLFMILGSVILPSDYSLLEDGPGDSTIRYPYYLMQVFRNSLGDLQTPSYQFWQDVEHPNRKIVVYLIWFTWVGCIVFASLLMLNFLITVFSETHEKVLANAIDYHY
jgi:Trk-type K+ transport system membrane component